MSSQAEYYRRMVEQVPIAIESVKYHQKLMTKEGYNEAKEELEKCFELIK